MITCAMVLKANVMTSILSVIIGAMKVFMMVFITLDSADHDRLVVPKSKNLLHLLPHYYFPPVDVTL